MDEESVATMKERFHSKLNKVLEQKGSNTQIFTEDGYYAVIEKVKVAKEKTGHKLPEDYQRLKRYDVLTIGNMEKLIVPVTKTDLIKFYVHTGEVFQIIHDAHLSLGHAGRNKMAVELNKRFKNITREMLQIYLNLCTVCKKKLHVVKVTKNKPYAQECLTKCQVELIEIEPDDGYKYILIYQDRQTNFVQLRPLKTQNLDEIANVLVDIFTIIGAPCVLLNSVSRELSNNIIKHITEYIWPQLKMVHGAVETEAVDLVTDVKERIDKWCGKNGKKWVEALRFVQFYKNTECEGKPYQAMFGTNVKLGLSILLPEELSGSITSEEDLENYLVTGEYPIPDSVAIKAQENMEIAGPSHIEIDTLDTCMDIKLEESLVMKIDDETLQQL